VTAESLPFVDGTTLMLQARWLMLPALDTRADLGDTFDEWQRAGAHHVPEPCRGQLRPGGGVLRGAGAGGGVTAVRMGGDRTGRASVVARVPPVH
jgi:hypothetical protein